MLYIGLQSDLTKKVCTAIAFDFGLQEACTKQPRLRKNAAVLARDIAAVGTGLRAAIMVDYMPLSSSAMLAILADVQAQCVDPKQCMLLTWQPLIARVCFVHVPWTCYMILHHNVDVCTNAACFCKQSPDIHAAM